MSYMLHFPMSKAEKVLMTLITCLEKFTQIQKQIALLFSETKHYRCLEIAQQYWYLKKLNTVKTRFP